ncbi:hypothetical protein [Dyella sp. Tek66A03]|uniref:hypothetical protein n=1 Tax=Dyella sp. Tek66A03 TaxID=3458298 RepID=UPI00403E8C27
MTHHATSVSALQSVDVDVDVDRDHGVTVTLADRLLMAHDLGLSATALNLGHQLHDEHDIDSLAEAEPIANPMAQQFLEWMLFGEPEETGVIPIESWA